MSQAETLLQSLTEEVTGHTHVVTDPDSYFVINPDTREIENSSRTKNVLMQFDHNSEVYTFELARYVEGHDMTLCNRVRVHFNNVDGTTLEENADVAELYDLDICPDDENKVLCSWTITRQATQLIGTLNFLVQYECIDENGDAVYEWHSDIYTDVKIKKTINNAEQAIVEYSNILEQWYQRIFGSGDAVLANITTEGENQVSAVAAEGNKQVSAVAAKGDEYVAAISNEGTAQKEAIALKGEETLATIPEDYTDTYNMAEEALRRKANVIELEAAGEIISIEDSSDAHLLGLNVYGKSDQFTTTGKNLFNAYAERNESFANAVVENNGAKIVVTGNYYVSWPIALKAGVEYYVDFKVDGDTAYRAVRFEYPDKEITNTITNPATFTPSQDTVSVYLYAGLGTEGTVIYNNVQISEGSTALSWEPYTGGMPSPNPDYPQEIASVGNPTVSICGKNLLDIPESYTINKATGINVNLPAGDYVLSFDSESHDGAENPEFRFYDNKIWKTLTETTKPHVVKLSKDETKIYLYSNGTSSNASEGVSATVNKLMVSKIDGAYEPYKPVQTFTVNRTLSGIPVTLGGNRIDSDGQRWICDEVDMERGVYIQRIGKVELTGSEYITKSAYKWQKDGMYSAYAAPFTSSDQYGIDIPDAVSWCFSTHAKPNSWEWANFDYLDNVGVRKNIIHLSFNNKTLGITTEDSDATKFEKFKAYLVAQYEAGTPVSVWYPLATPIETPLTDEEIAYYKKLKTNYHDTTVLNNHNAHTVIKYAADTLIYMRDHQPKPTDEQVKNSVNIYLDQNGVQVPSDAHIKSISDKSISETIPKLNIPSDDDIKNIADSAISEAINKLDITSSWNELTDKPFYSETTPDIIFTADDIANPIERIEIPDGEGVAYVKVSDRIFTADELDGMSVTYIPGGGLTEEKTDNSPFIDKDHTMLETGIGIGTTNEGTMIGVMIEQETDIGANSPLTVGLWLVDYGTSTTKILSVTIPGNETIKQLDSKFLNPALQFGETTVKGDTLAWDGNTDGLLMLDAPEIGEPVAYKISDAIITENDYANGATISVLGESAQYSAEYITHQIVENNGAVYFSDWLFYAAKDNSNIGEYVFPKPGWYHLDPVVSDGILCSITIPGFNGFETKTIKTIDPKYLPETAKVDKDEIVNSVLEALPTWTVGGSY